MVLILTNESSTMNKEDVNAPKKSPEIEEPKRVSLLVDYSKRKAKISSARKAEILDKLVANRKQPMQTVADTIDDALSITNNDPFNESLNLEDMQPVQNVSFRVRKASIRRTKSMDERKISSYDHLQNSIRSTFLMQDDDEDGEDDEKSKASDKESEVTPQSPAPKSPTPPTVDRRQLLANARRKNQSMRNMSSRSISSRSICSPTVGPLSPCSSSVQFGRRTRTAPTDMLSQTIHEGCAASSSTGRRAMMVGMKQCTSCRSMMRRTKSQNDSPQLVQEVGMSVSLHSGSSLSPTRPTLSGMKGHSRRQMQTQSLSRRHLMQSSMNGSGRIPTTDDDMDSSMVIFATTGPRIRRHGNNA